MAYYLVNIERGSHGIGSLNGARLAVIETVDGDDLYNSNIRVHYVDYLEHDYRNITFKSPAEQERTWRIEKELRSLPALHKFKVGDKVRVKKDHPYHPSYKHVYDDIIKLDKPLEVSMVYYYEWGNKSYAVIGFKNGYGAWAPEEMFELDSVTSSSSPKRDKGGFNVGDTVLVNVYQGCGIPYPLDRDEIVTIVDDEYHKRASGSDHWTHIAAFNGKYVALDYVRGKFRHVPKSTHYKDKGGFSQGEHVYATNCGGNGLKRGMYIVRIVDDSYANIASGLLKDSDWTHIVEQDGLYYRVNYKTAKFAYPETNPCKEIPLGDVCVVDTDVATMYPETYTRCFNPISPEECVENKKGIQVLKLQKPIILKSKKHKSWK